MSEISNKSIQSVNSAGERSVAIGGNATDVTINTGDTYNVYPLTGTVNTVVDSILASKIEVLSSDLSKEKAQKLEDLLEKFRDGRSDEALGGIRELRNSSNWDAFEPVLKASILRTLAQLTLILKNKDGVEEARSFAAEARRFNQTTHDEVLEARINVFEIGFEAAAEKFVKIRTTESYNLWLNCLLNSGKFADVVNAHTDPPEDIKLNAESHRFFALAYLALKNIDAARKEIRIALEEKPNWQYVRLTDAMIDYYSALSPTVLPDQLVSYPRTFPFVWTKIDDASQSSLRLAGQEFARLAEEFTSNPAVARECRTWHFACIINQLEKQTEGIEIGLKLLAKDPANLQILSWFLFRGYEFEREQSLIALTRKDESGTASIEDALGLIGIHLNSQNWELALEVINRNNHLFDQVGESDLLRYWQGTTLLQGEQPNEAKIVESEMTNPQLKRLLNVNILYNHGEKLKDWKPLLNFWEESYRKDNDSESFLSIFELKAQKIEDKKFIAEKADRYCELTQTASAVDFTVRALLKWQEEQQGLALLEKYIAFFPGNKLPGHLQRTRIHALLRSDYKRAYLEAVALAKESPTPENMALLLDAQLIRGDFSGLVSTSKELLQHEQTGTEQFLRAANIVKAEDANLAVKLWTKAINSGASDDLELAVLAQDIAFKLGLETESNEIHRMLMREAHAKRGPMKLMTIKQVLKLAEKNAKRQRQIDEKYGAGELPLQIVAEEKNMSLAQIFYWRADKNRESANIH